ncbi:MAG TPA: hypothetical protein VMN36_19100 [Verrucomicrobiales bacterium]|nr:hypothetical protein [Verrucomicrobiales bacterium]
MRSYRTGDLGWRRWDAGRRDFQIKVRGHRVEFGQIETAFLKFPGIRECVVTAINGQRQEHRLVAVVELLVRNARSR